MCAQISEETKPEVVHVPSNLNLLKRDDILKEGEIVMVSQRRPTHALLCSLRRARSPLTQVDLLVGIKHMRMTICKPQFS